MKTADKENGLGATYSWAHPSPLIVQRRAAAVERALLLETIARIAIILIADCLILFVSHELVDSLRSGSGPIGWIADLVNEVFPRGTFPLGEVLSAVLIGLAIFGNYRSGFRWHNARNLFAGSSLGLSLVFWNTLWAGASLQALFGFLFLLIGTGIALTTGREVLHLLVTRVRPKPIANSRALILGPRKRAEHLKKNDAIRTDRRLKIVGHLNPDGHADEGSLGVLSDLVWIVERDEIDTIIIAETLDEDVLADVLVVAERTGCTTISGSPLFPIGGFVPKLVRRGLNPYVAITRPSLRVPQLVWKRAFDILAATALLVVLSPLFALIGVAIRVTSKGPVFFKQVRVGYGGRYFHMYKFRSMVNNADQLRAELTAESIYADARLFKVPNDPRVTRLGRFLRRSSLDELPQLWNVLRGEMSMVGPRPPLASEVETYEEHNYTRFDMKPGITGPWQVSGRNVVTTFDEVVALETNYLTDWSLAKDVVILIKTIPAVLSMRGAV